MANEVREMAKEVTYARKRSAPLRDVEPHVELGDPTVGALRRYGASVYLLALGSRKRRPPDHHLGPSNRTAWRRTLLSPLLVLASAGGEL